MKKKDFTTKLEVLLLHYNPDEQSNFNQLIDLVYETISHKVQVLLSHETLVHRWHQTDDIIQNTLIQLERALHTTRPKTKKEFLFLASRIVQHVIIDLARNLRGQNSDAAHHHTTKNINKKTGMLSQSEGMTIDNAELWLEINDLLEHSLQPQDCDIVRLHLFMELNQEEIARELEISLSTVKRKWRNALYILSDKMKLEE